MNDDKVKLSTSEKLKKFFLSLVGKPYLYFKADYNQRTGLVGVEFDYNSAMLNQIREQGYTHDDPDEAMRYALMEIMSEQKEDFFGDDSDEEITGEPEYIHERYKK